MSNKLSVFVSSVQKELEDERLIVQNLLNTDAFLSAHCTPVLYEFEPASPGKALEGCLESLDGCQVYLLIVGAHYGTRVGAISLTHAEYRRAKGRELPVLAFIKGDRSVKREEGTTALLAEIDADGFKYKRFANVIEIQKEVRAALVKLLADKFGIAPSSDEDKIAQQTIEATSSFESQPLARLRWQDLDHEVLRRLIAAAENRDAGSLSAVDLVSGASARGLVWRDQGSGETYATAAGIVLLAKDPSMVFPQCRILADAYRSTEPDATRGITRTSGRRCRWRSIAPSPSSIETHATQCVSSGLTACASTSTLSMACARRWSTRWRTASTRTPAARLSSRSSLIVSSS
jgi:predicted HTH transcriptional regulator